MACFLVFVFLFLLPICPCFHWFSHYCYCLLWLLCCVCKLHAWLPCEQIKIIHYSYLITKIKTTIKHPTLNMLSHSNNSLDNYHPLHSTQTYRFNDFYARYTSLMNSSKIGPATTTTTTTTAKTGLNTRPLSHPSMVSTNSSQTTGGGKTSSYQPYVPLSHRRQMGPEKGTTAAVSITTPTSPVGSTAGATISTGRRLVQFFNII